MEMLRGIHDFKQGDCGHRHDCKGIEKIRGSQTFRGV